jgi:hypothetical protein
MHGFWSWRAAGIRGMQTKPFTNSLILKSIDVRFGEFRGHGICPVNLAGTAVL